ncbi:hypothetical protein M9H77_26032 [Catharanthus roseus]|uniref:Uncharacterized protein n=1 Tax=Catharanthus roseus TaxID=4058 RepID=A0ACC0AAN0_CATRO|nr:hypothetical protein M9H77_26032 [Catharanthus roseus]
MPHVLFTGLEDYKARGTQASPYFVVTYYKEFAESKGLALIRGDIVLTSKLTDSEAKWLLETMQSFYLNDVRFYFERLVCYMAFHSFCCLQLSCLVLPSISPSKALRILVCPQLKLVNNLSRMSFTGPALSRASSILIHFLLCIDKSRINRILYLLNVTPSDLQIQISASIGALVFFYSTLVEISPMPKQMHFGLN